MSAILPFRNWWRLYIWDCVKRPEVLVAGLAIFMSPAGMAANILKNPGFETGDFTGWQASYCCNPDGNFTVTPELPHQGSYAADLNTPGSTLHPENMDLAQTFSPVPVEDVLEVSFWVRTLGELDGITGQFRAKYSDGTFSFFNIPQATSEWQKVDMTAILTPGKKLQEILILNSGGGPIFEVADRDFYDDFVVLVQGKKIFSSGFE